jgi:protein-tyrosine phosphatase
MIGKPKESDWKHFRDTVEDLRERYLKEKNKELVEMLTNSEKTPTEQFWDTLEAIKKEKKILQDCLDGHSRSKMFISMCLMLRYGMLKENGLEGFSEDLQELLKTHLNR